MKSKNVLIVISVLGVGGTEIQTLNTVRALVHGGYKVTVLCLFRYVASVVAKYERCGAKVYCASPQYNDYGIKIIYPRRLSLLFFLYKHLSKVIKREKIDIIHVQNITPASSVILVSYFLLFKRNIIATAHTSADIYKDLRLIHFLQRHCLRTFTCITERAERSFFGSSQLYTTDTVLGKRNHFTIYNCLPPAMQGQSTVNSQQAASGVGSQFHADSTDSTEDICQRDGHTNLNALTHTQACAGQDSQRLNENNNNNDDCIVSQHSTLNTQPYTKRTLGVVSRLEPIKGMDLVVPAFAEVLKAHPDTLLLVVGDGSLRASMEQQAVELGCADHIRWVGRQPQEELSQWYGQMDIVLMPSRSEGFGLTAIEAMACGCVMVASDVGGLPEVVRDGECGLLHRTEDVPDMAAKITTLIRDQELYNKLKAQSLREVEKYSFERYAELIHNLYGKL